jgi:endonuclease G
MPNVSASRPRFFLARFSLLLGLGLAVLPALPGCRLLSPEKPATRTTRQPTGGTGGGTSGAVRSTGRDNSSLMLGNPSSAGSQPNNLLLDIPQYAMSYNASLGGPNWVSWHLEEGDLGDVERSTFRPNPVLPVSLQIRPADYKGSGYDRGHVCPSGDRTRTERDNQATFQMSNMLPQAAALNQHVWKDLEDHCRDLARAGNELYISAGGAGSLGRIANGRVNIPAACWKIIVVLPRGNNDLGRINARTRVIAVAMPNKDTDAVQNAAWSQYVVSPARIEKATGLRFFATLPTNVRAALEASTDSGSDDDARSGRGRSRVNTD